MTNIIKVNFGRKWYQYLEDLIQEHLNQEVFPGVEILFAAHGEIRLHRAWGRLEVGQDAPTMNINTIFDIASLTKPIAVATSIMLMMEQGLLDLEEPAHEFLPEFKGGHRELITLKHLLCHTSGLPAWENLYEGAQSKDEVWNRLMQVELVNEVGREVVYSCLGYLILGEIIRRISKTQLSVYVKEAILSPLQMNSTQFSAWNTLKGQIIAPTQYCPYRQKLLRGVVHDENAYVFDEEGGNAGLFSTSIDLFRFSQMLFNGGELDGVRLLSTPSIQKMVENHTFYPNVPRGIGWDIKGKGTGYTSCGELMPYGCIGHTGFTGTSIWMDLPAQICIIVLSNRVHIAREKNIPAMKRFRPRLHNVLMSALETFEPWYD